MNAYYAASNDESVNKTVENHEKYQNKWLVTRLSQYLEIDKIIDYIQ